MKPNLILLTALLLAPLAALHADDLLSLTPDSAMQVNRAHKAGLIEIAPVHLPPPDAGDCNHYGWPIATMTGDTLVVMHRRIPGHKAAGAGKPHRMELWLWSMAPADWDQGQWKRECRLVATRGKFYSTADGFHPAGAVIDEKLGVQHIFIYSGHPNGPAGVFRITRALDTAKLTRAMGDKQP